MIKLILAFYEVAMGTEAYCFLRRTIGQAKVAYVELHGRMLWC